MINPKSHKFIKIPGTVNMVGIKTARGITEMPGVRPLLDENFHFLNVIAVGNKNGIDDKINLPLLKKLFPSAKLIYDCECGPYLVSCYQEILGRFDGHMTLDFDRANPKSLFMHHTIMIRSMPFEGFFWEPQKERRWDFSILTTVGDNVSKRWDRCIKIVRSLCSRGLTGLIVTQKHDFARVLKFRKIFSRERVFRKYSKAGLLHLADYLPYREFHNLQAMARVGIFPNACDAFPRTIPENILANKLVIISDDLLIGKSTVAPEFGECLDFDSDLALDKCFKIIEKEKRRKTPLKNRQRWLKKYNFLSVAKSWAVEINKKFKTNCKFAFFMNHIDRIRQNKLDLALKENVKML